MSDDGELLLEDGPDNKRLRIKLNEFKGRPLLDLRYWYKDKKSGDMKPGSKGISLTRANYLCLRSVAVDHHNAIMEYLDVGTIPGTHQGDRNLVAARQVSKQQPISNINIEIKPLQPSSKLFEVEYQGALAKVVLNKNHPLVERIATSGEISEEIGMAVGILLVSLDMSLLSFYETDLTSPRIVVEQLEFDFDKLTNQISRKVK